MNGNRKSAPKALGAPAPPGAGGGAACASAGQKTLTLPGGRVIACQLQVGHGGADDTPVVFLPGFASDMTGTKAVWLAERLQAQGRTCLRFDYTGHGRSSGRFRDGTIGQWMRDAQDVVEAMLSRPALLVGSSMGGWIAFLLARARPDSVAGLVGIAAAPDFTTDLIETRMTDAEREVLARKGTFLMPCDGEEEEPIPITAAFLEDGRRRTIFGAPLRLPFPVRLLHGMEDAEVPPSTALRLLAHMQCADARAVLVKGADHRFSTPGDLRLLGECVDGILAKRADG